jgi:hypothetical protein
MPIRMRKDKSDGNSQSGRPRRRRSSASESKGVRGLGGNLVGILIYALPWLLKRPKVLAVLVVLGVVVYFFFGRDLAALPQDGSQPSYFTGGNFDKAKYEETEIFEPLADNIKNPLPTKVSLLEYAPSRLNQGRQGSCVAWASAYAARTILEARRTGNSPNSVRFSPSFMYNQISTDHYNCQGSYISLAMNNMLNQGAVAYSDFKYDPSSCSRKPTSSLKRKANKYKINGFQRLTEDGQSGTAEMLAIKQNLAHGSPVIIGMLVGGTFMSDMNGRDLWEPTDLDYDQNEFGGHAMCVIGYDDYMAGGSFQLMNSWGEQWGEQGICWIRYSDFRYFNVESYGVYPMGNANDVAQKTFSGSFALELNSGAKTIVLKHQEGIYFETVGKLSSNDKFKVEFTNNIECYTYIFGKEMDGSAYVLFPYTQKHSPYCGVTGTRLFPRDYSMQADDLGKKDKIAVLITKEPIDYNDMNNRINSGKAKTFEERVEIAMAGKYDNNVRFSGTKMISFEGSTSKEKDIVFVIGVKK